MKMKTKSLIDSNFIFGLIGLMTGLLLLIPLMAMRFDWRFPDPGISVSDRVDWSLFDFLLMGGLLFGMSSAYVLLARKLRSHRLIVGVVLLLIFLWLWAELAVGVFTNWGS